MQFGKDAIEAIWRRQCGAWEWSDAACVQSFLVECLQHNLDPQDGLNWIIEHRTQLSDADAVVDAALRWVNEHTSTGFPVSGIGAEQQE
ncbi:hypothetical protein [Geobacillus sp. CAMR5420]|jgi:hypothetical protein|uniref:hypothetical protein n=1 Tax=Geobacillus TaxID=129337 RepID=UPI0004A03346|nr:hypothetical protein [Geobacillus sp. CAMR5420]KDE48798.1 hypothetical protein DI44_08410 [Geobacillus sp. CAMR5420]